jgi:hypothetical protein
MAQPPTDWLPRVVAPGRSTTRYQDDIRDGNGILRIRTGTGSGLLPTLDEIAFRQLPTRYRLTIASPGAFVLKLSRIAAAGIIIAGFAVRAHAQGDNPYAINEMNIDMWCQEEQHLPPARCDKRLPEDDAAFQVYRNNIENYEIPYLQRKQDEQTVNRVILHNDPVDHPTRPSQPQTEQPQGR